MYVSCGMLRWMRTTVRLEEGLLRAAKAEAHRRGETLTAMLERGLRLVLAGPPRAGPGSRVTLPVSRARRGLQPDVDLDDTSAVIERLEGRR